MLVKKYGNRRLYDTQDSRYITLEELEAKVRAGADVRVVDAKTNEDLTQSTLTQIILESRGAGKLLPVPLLVQLIRLGDDALADFFGRYVVWALEVYLQTRSGLSTLNPLAGAMMNPLSRMLGSFPMPFGFGQQEQAAPPPPPPAPPSNEMAELRRKLEALEKSVGGRKKRK